MKEQSAKQQKESRVSTLEPFFDLVFVFTITQLTHLVEQAHNPLDFLLILLVLMLIWWMYDGYSWLTNAAGVQGPMRLILLAAMIGFFVMALALPRVFGADGLVFGFAYLFVIVLHLVGFFMNRGQRGVYAALFDIAPFNIAAAVLVIAAGFIHTTWNWLFFLAAVALFAIATLFRRERFFPINASHFIERHGLIILIVLGESVVDIGTGATNRLLDALTIITIILSLVLIAALWWSYFDRDDGRAERALVSASPEVRPRMALLGYWYAHLAMIAGIVLIATGIKQVVSSSGGPLQESAWLLVSGTSLYLFGDVVFRRVMGIRPVIVRALGVAIVIPLGVIGLLFGGIAELATVSALAIALLWFEQKLEQGKNQFHT